MEKFRSKYRSGGFIAEERDDIRVVIYPPKHSSDWMDYEIYVGKKWVVSGEIADRGLLGVRTDPFFLSFVIGDDKKVYVIYCGETYRVHDLNK